jgi:pre-rRNA-processing protein TSR3
MFEFPPTVILRHKQENLKKCSLKGLETRNDIRFLTYPKDPLPHLENYILLDLDAPPLTREDGDKGIFLIDGTWRYAALMHRYVKKHGSFHLRSVPGHCRTAYPRKQTDCSDPERGLASVEALFLAYAILGRNVEGILDNYYWKDAFLKLNGMEYANTFKARAEY